MLGAGLALLVLLPGPVLLGHGLRLLQLVHDEQVPGQRHVRRVAEAALPALVGGAVGLVLRDVFVELEQVFGGEAAHGTLVDLKHIDLELLQWLSNRSPGRPEF